MYKITGRKAGIVWDTDNNKPLARFVKGVAVVDNKEAADKLAELGCEVERVGREPLPEGAPSEEWTVPQLREFAHAAGVDLGKATKKTDILAILAGQPT